MASTYTIGTAEGVIRITYDPAGVAAAKKDQEALGASSVKAGSAMSKSSKVMAVGGLLIAAGLGEAAKQASDFQAKMTLLVTAGGESQQALGMVGKGIESIAIKTGTSLDQLADGMYIVEKAGKHGAEGLRVLEAAAEGAKAEGTDLTVMTTGLTSIMQSYASTMKDPVQATNELVAASGLAKASMQDFVNSLPNVLPLASAVGISFAQVGGALATLTQHGTSAAEASQELNNTIRALVAPNTVASKAMQQLGINVTDLEKNVGKRGLTGSIAVVVDAIGKHMGPAGLVLVNTFMQSQSAGEDLKEMMGTFKGPMLDLAQQFMAGKISAQDWSGALKGMAPIQQSQMQQFATLAKRAGGFNTLLRQGSPAAQTMTAALKQTLGGATGMNTALQLSGESAGYFNDAVNTIGESANKTGKDVSTWATTQKNASVQLGRAKAAGQVLTVQLGTVLLPTIIKIAKALAGFMGWFASLSSGWQKTIVGVLGVVAALLLLASTFKKLEEAAKALKALALFLKLDVLWTNLMAAATKAWAVVQAILDAEMWASPIGLIIAAVVALAVAVFLVIKYHKQIAAFFVMIWGKIWSFMKMIGAWFAGPFVNFFKTIGRAIMAFFSPVWSFFKAIGAWFAGPFAAFFVGLWHDMEAIWSGIVSVFKTAFNIIMIPLKLYFAFWKGVWNLFAPLVKAIFGLIVAIVTLALKLVWMVVSLYLMLIIKLWNLVWGAIQTAWNATWNFIKMIFSAAWDWIWGKIQAGMAMVRAAWSAFTGALQTAWNAVWNFIKGIVMAFWNWIHPYIQTAINVVSAIISSAWNHIKAVTTSIWNLIIGVVKAVWGKIKTALAAIAAVGGIIGGYFQKAYDAVKTKVLAVVSYVAGLGSKIIKAIGNTGSMLYNAGKDIIQGLINGITNMIGKLTSKLKSVTKMIPSWKGPATVDAKLLTPNGKLIMAGLIDGILKATPALKKTLQGITTSIPMTVASGASSQTYTTQMSAARSSSTAAAPPDHGPYYLPLDGKVVAEFVIDAVTGEPKLIKKTSDEGARQTSWAGSGRKGSV